MSIPKFSRVFQVGIRKYDGTKDNDEFIMVLAEDVEDAVSRGYIYADLLDEPEVLFYEVISANLRSEVFVGIEDEVEEVEIIPEGV